MARSLAARFAAVLIAAVAASASGGGADISSVSVTFDFSAPAVRSGATGIELALPGHGVLPVPGAPAVPARLAFIAVPPGAEVERIEFEAAPLVALPGEHALIPAPLPRRLDGAARAPGEPDPALFAANRAAIYASDEPYPAAAATLEGQAAYRRYDVACVRLAPVAYRPLSGRLAYHPSITVRVHYRAGARPDRLAAAGEAPLAGPEAIARSLLANHAAAQTWYPAPGAAPRTRGLHPLVVVTTEALAPACAALLDWEGRKGNAPALVTVESIAGAYPGGDLAEQIRNCLRARLPSSEWGIEDVLLVGHHTEVPMRTIAQGERPRTDFYFAELSRADADSWDSSGNREYAEDSDDIDLLAEVNVGRIPWSDPAIVARVAAKCAAFETDADEAYKHSAFFMGSFVWETTDGAVLAELLLDQPWMTDWSATRLYEQNESFWSSYPCELPLNRDNVQAAWPTGRYSYANWIGHGAPRSAWMTAGTVPFFKGPDTNLLDDGSPAIVFGNACSNSQTDETNIGMQLLENGAVGFVGATQVAYGVYGWDDPNDGECSSMNYYFATAVTPAAQGQGAAHQQALREMYARGLFWNMRLELCFWALWGNPCLGLATLAPSNGTVDLGAPEVRPDAAVLVTVVDCDLDADFETPDTVAVEVATSGGDQETLVLTETGPHSTELAAALACTPGAAAPGSGALEVAHGEIVTVTYVDADDGLGGLGIAKQATCRIDGLPPVLTAIGVEQRTERSALVVWRTDEPADTVLRWGTEPPLAFELAEGALTTEHAVPLAELAPGTTYFFEVASTDLAGNRAEDQAHGSYHRFRTMLRVPFYVESMEIDPLWTISGGDWAFGQPQGQSGTFGPPDPTAGVGGPNVYGYNLAGGYPHYLLPQSLTSAPIDCRGRQGVAWEFERWLGVEGIGADRAALALSVEGGPFAPVWENPWQTLPGGAWEHCRHDVGELADGASAVRLRWIMGPTNEGKSYCGWNIDEVALTSLIESSAPTPTPLPTWTPTPTPLPAALDLSLSGTLFEAGDPFRLTALAASRTAQAAPAALAVVLAAGGRYWFHPSWGESPDWQNMMLAAGEEAEFVILDFVWPAGDFGQAEGILLIGALLDPTALDLMSEPDWVEFAYR